MFCITISSIENWQEYLLVEKCHTSVEMPSNICRNSVIHHLKICIHNSKTKVQFNWKYLHVTRIHLSLHCQLLFRCHFCNKSICLQIFNVATSADELTHIRIIFTATYYFYEQIYKELLVACRLDVFSAPWRYIDLILSLFSARQYTIYNCRLFYICCTFSFFMTYALRS